MTPLTILRRSAAQRAIAPLLVVVSALMIIVGKVDQAVFESIRVSIVDHLAAPLALLSRPMTGLASLAERVRAAVAIYDDNLTLSEENRRLLQWQQTALALADQNRQLRALLKLVPEHARAFVSARVIASSGGAYLRNLLVDAGSADGVARGQAVIAGEGLVGRVYEVGLLTARVLLLSDLNSRVPVIVERSRQRAILAGDNSPSPSLWYLDPAAPVRVGDRILTAGEGGVFPPGLPVGVVTAAGPGAPRVTPYVRLSQLEYVRIVDYGLADSLPPPVAATPKPGLRAAAALPNRR